ncbi:MAG: winged helix-turn-helix transcriptional regulator [Magnetococcales bacterium]|nr:winged helix-turn-helix transcriptional regulator [Magnetococcales bacterium]
MFNIASLNRLTNALAYLVQEAPGLGLRPAVVLLATAQQPGITVRELAKRMDETSSTILKNANELCRAFDFVRLENESKGQNAQVVMTEKGEQLVLQIIERCQ